MRRGNSGYEEMKSPEYEKAGDHFGHEGVEILIGNGNRIWKEIILAMRSIRLKMK